MRRPAPADSAPSWPRSSRNIASITSKRRSCASPGGTRPTRMPSNGPTSQGRRASPTGCAARSRGEMGRYVVKLPDIGEGTTEAEIVAWHVTPGQAIREEDPLVDVMTDKATVELPAPMAGTVVAINGKVGEKRPVGSELVVLEVAGEGNVAAAGAHPHPPAAIAAGPPSPAV